MDWIGKIGREENRVYFRENSLVSKGRRDRANSFLSFLAIDQPIRDSHEKMSIKKIQSQSRVNYYLSAYRNSPNARQPSILFLDGNYLFRGLIAT